MGDSLCDNNGMLLIYVRDKRNKLVYKGDSNIGTLPTLQIFPKGIYYNLMGSYPLNH
ncbi:unnamed protein product [Meloidogyne enterolobii]|uniref:Uncharacterized protein n=1 Tax=Meloidogyne enterolobii TaxID=390850 RepID=A0ACB0YL93_MELEN